MISLTTSIPLSRLQNPDKFSQFSKTGCNVQNKISKGFLETALTKLTGFGIGENLCNL